MKKLIAFLLASAVSVAAFAFVGCGGTPNGDSGSNNSNPNLPNGGAADGDDENNSDPNTPGVNISYNSKPAMPADKDMQTVSGEKAYEEYSSYYQKIKENGYGKFQAYAFRDENSHTEINTKDENTGTDYVAQGTDIKHYEMADVYGGINDNGVKTGVVTTCSNEINERKFESEYENYPYAMYNYANYKITDTAVQKGTQCYDFKASDITINDGKKEETVKNDKRLDYYVDNPRINEDYAGFIPCLQLNKIGYSTHAIFKISGYLDMASKYLKNNDDSCLNDLDMGIIESWLGASTEYKNFELTAKKNENKFYSTVKYDIVLKRGNNTLVVKNEYAVLLDLNEAKTNDLPTDGIELNSLSLTTAIGKGACPDITSEQLSKAVKEEKEITVDIIGSGNVSALTITGLTGGPNDVLPVVDGKVTLDGAKLKKLIDDFKKSYEDNGLVCPYLFNICFSYYLELPEENIIFDMLGKIYIDY